MKFLVILAIFTPALGQMTANPDDAQLRTRILQLMESTAVAVPGLARASEPLRQNAAGTLATLQGAPPDPAGEYLFIKQAKTYVVLSESYSRPADFPAVADRQCAELVEDLQRLERHFQTILEARTREALLRAADPSELKYYAEANSKLLPPGKNQRVVFLGDSVTEAWRLNEYFPGRDFVNRGIPGQTTLQMLGRFLQDVVAVHPRLVVLAPGVKDLALGITLSDIEDGLTMMGDVAKAHGVGALYASILPIPATARAPFSTPAIQQINRWMKDYCIRNGYLYIDYFGALADPSGNLRPELTDDGFHPNARGYRIMAPVAIDAIGRALSNEQNPPPEPPRRRFRLLNK